MGVLNIKRAPILATRARVQAKYYQNSTVGYNYRMSNVLAGVGRVQLDERVKKRNAMCLRALKRHLAGFNGVMA